MADEDGADLASLREGFFEAWAPVGAFEAFLVDRLTNLAWKISRAERLEVELFDKGVHADEIDRLQATISSRWALPNAAEADLPPQGSVEGREGGSNNPERRLKAIAKLNLADAFVHLSMGEDFLGRALRYQGEAERSFLKTINALERLQRQRRGDHVEAPVTVDVNFESSQERAIPGPQLAMATSPVKPVKRIRANPETKPLPKTKGGGPSPESDANVVKPAKASTLEDLFSRGPTQDPETTPLSDRLRLRMDTHLFR